MAGRIDFEYQFNNNSGQKAEDSVPMSVYFLDDFSGKESAKANQTTHSIVRIDIDSFDDAMIRLKPTIALSSGHQLTFNELEDFHPDNLYETDVFKNLRRLKKELASPSTADSAAQEIITSFQLDNSNTGEEASTIEDSDATVERLLGKKPSATATSSTHSASKLDVYLADIIGAHIIKDANPEHQSLKLFIDNAIEEIMNAILHSSEFQTLEASWRSVRDVVFNEHYDDHHQFFYLVNTSELALQSAVDGNTEMVTKLTQHINNVDTEHFNVLIGSYCFSAANDDIAKLNYLASFAETQGCQLVCAAADDLVHSTEASLWHDFRKMPQAAHVALTYPRVLLRNPYGKKHDEVDAFAFEEFRETHQHEELLWGNSAYACARLLVRQYHGQVKYDGSISELPAFVFEQEDQQVLHPCGEFLLSEQQLMAIRAQGIVPFVSFRNKNAIRLFGDEVTAVNV